VTLAVSDLQRRKEAGRAVADVVVGGLGRQSGPHRQDRRGPIQGLDLGLFIDAEHDGVLVGSDQGAVSAFQPIRLPGPPSEPDVRVGPASGSPHAHASRSGRIACPLVQLGLDIQYPQPSRISVRPQLTDIHRRTPDIPRPHCGHAVPLRHVTGFPGRATTTRTPSHPETIN